MSELKIPEECRLKLKNLQNSNVLITGGSGFLGQNLCRFMLEIGCNVTVVDLNCFVISPKIKYISGSVLDYDLMKIACQNIDIVFHAASPSPLSKDENLLKKINIDGTKTVIKACNNSAVKSLIYVSSASVVFDGKDQCYIDESKQFRPKSVYAKSKLSAEKIVLTLSKESLAVCILRPHSIFGPGDTLFMRSLVNTAIKEKSRYIVGRGQNLVDFTYVLNVCYALALAASKLGVGSQLNRKVYFITNKEKVKFWDFLKDIYKGLGYQEPWLNVPLWVFSIMLRLQKIMGYFEISLFSDLNKASIDYASKHHYYCDEKATRDFGYIPIVSMAEAKKENLRHFAYYKNPNFDSNEPKNIWQYIKKFFWCFIILLMLKFWDFV